MLEELNGDFLQWLRGFYFTAKTGSVRAASEKMHRSPSTISYQIRALENELNTVLFDRYKKNLKITPEGRELLAWTITTFENLQSMMASVGNADGELKGSVNIAATLPFAALVLENIVSFRSRHPQVNVHLHRALPADVARLVHESRTDFGLIGIANIPDSANMEVFFKSRPLLAFHKDAPWKVPAVPSFEDIAKLPIIAFQQDNLATKDLSFRDHVPEHLFKNAVASVNNQHLILRLVRRKMGVALLDEMAFLATTAYGANWSVLQTRPLDHLLPNTFYGTYVRPQRHLSPQAKALLDDIRDTLQGLETSDCSEIWAHIERVNLIQERSPAKKSRK